MSKDPLIPKLKELLSHLVSLNPGFKVGQLSLAVERSGVLIVPLGILQQTLEEMAYEKLLIKLIFSIPGDPLCTRALYFPPTTSFKFSE